MQKAPSAVPLGSEAAPMEQTALQQEKGSCGKPRGLPAEQDSRRDHEQSGFAGAWLQRAFVLQSPRNHPERVDRGYTICEKLQHLLRERGAGGLRAQASSVPADGTGKP